jgi:predicted nucleotide-binding protein
MIVCKKLSQAASDMPSIQAIPVAQPAFRPATGGETSDIDRGRADVPAGCRVAQALAEQSQRIFVVYGRNRAARFAIFAFLRSIGLAPIEWSQAVAATGKASPYISEVIDTAIDAAQAVIVLWTPDEIASLRPEYADGEDDPEVRPAAQARPNVMFEAGLALGRAPERVVLVEMGRVRHFSDIVGRYTVCLSNSVSSRHDLAIRLQTAGCAVDLSGTDWHTAGDFTSPPPLLGLHEHQGLGAGYRTDRR